MDFQVLFPSVMAQAIPFLRRNGADRPPFPDTTFQCSALVSYLFRFLSGSTSFCPAFKSLYHVSLPHFKYFLSRRESLGIQFALMSRHTLRVTNRKLNHKCLGKEAICVFIEALTANGPLNESNQGEDELRMVGCISKSKHFGGRDVTLPSVYTDTPAVEDIKRPSPKDSLVVAFNLHINALLESTPPSPLREKLTHFMEHDWHDIEKLLEGGKIDSVEDIKSHWRQIELLVGDTNDTFLQEGALLLSLALGETDLASDFYANVEGMEMCILEGMRDA
eukprot:Blabericola_migrator_1__7621@NODE_3896_length_1442_cov_18_758545_g2407_i0_p1_GENE_NODE_3896_length_1442_cov_18_758545_g2407_i0NODE_3896_length_1442_cov_18_758545_g2407_i0_p1_ORF_typecomplete_len278_score54_38_NODE_3896_length_1442_cov_18_758545_g2407_i080913